MRYSTFYLITPKSELIALTSSFEEGTQSLFTDEQLWENNEGGRSSWSLEGYKAKSKLAFMINMIGEYAGLPELEVIFPNGKISIELFDKFWSIKRYELQGNTIEVETRSIPKEAIDFTGLPDVDSWMSELVIQ